jgi:hypothetical protein
MKKTYGILAATLLIMGMVPIAVTAEPTADVSNEVMKQEKPTNKYQYKNQLYDQVVGPTQDETSVKIKVRGIWGDSGDNESDGYFGGYLKRRGRLGVFKGLYNLTGNETKTKIFGVMRHGYFNGRIITVDGNKCHIVGLYKIDKDNQLLKLRWMTPFGNGWGVGKIITDN